MLLINEPIGETICDLVELYYAARSTVILTFGGFLLIMLLIVVFWAENNGLSAGEGLAVLVLEV